MKAILPTLEEVIEMSEEQAGWCIACGEVSYGVEPDAIRYECEDCGRRHVYGAEQLAIMGLVK